MRIPKRLPQRLGLTLLKFRVLGVSTTRRWKPRHPATMTRSTPLAWALHSFSLGVDPAGVARMFRISHSVLPFVVGPLFQVTPNRPRAMDSKSMLFKVLPNLFIITLCVRLPHPSQRAGVDLHRCRLEHDMRRSVEGGLDHWQEVSRD
jgi:hypothetical protein